MQIHFLYYYVFPDYPLLKWEVPRTLMIPGLRERWVSGGHHKGGSRMVAFTLFYGITRRLSQSQLRRKVLEESSW